MRSFRHKSDDKRSTYLGLAGSIESQLRQAYAKRHEQGRETQASLAEKLGVNRSAVNRRLLGHTNMTIETLANMVWALGYGVKIEIFDPDTAATANTLDQAEDLHPRLPAEPAAKVKKPALARSP